MSRCKSCGGSLKLHGVSLIDEKMCFVCYLAKLNNNHIDKIADLETKLAEKEAELVGRKKLCDLRYEQLKNSHQDKIEFAIAELEKVKELAKQETDFGFIDEKLTLYKLFNILDQQIKELKGVGDGKTNG